jgi:hypothetical protein
MNMQFLVPSPLARGGTSEAFISFRVNVDNSFVKLVTVIDTSNGFAVSAT